MAQATRQMRDQHDEERYVTKMNLRSEKILQNQIHRLNKEKLMQVKSLTAQMRTYERKLQKINDRIEEVEQLTRVAEPSQRLPTREYMNRLQNDVTRQRHLATGAGYSHIDQLLGASRPLVHRAIRWGLNPSLPSLEQQISKPFTLVTDKAASKAFLTEIKGHPIHLRPREAHTKKQKNQTLVLPPLPMRGAPSGDKKQSVEDNVLRKTDHEPEQSSSKSNQLGRETPSPIIESINETKPRSPAEAKKIIDDENEQDENKQLDQAVEKQASERVNERSHIITQPEIVVERNMEVSDKEISSSSSLLRGPFITKFEFPSYGEKSFTRSMEMLNVESANLAEKGGFPIENKPNSFRYQLHARRFSL